MVELYSDRHSVLVSQASLWEVAIKVNPGRLSVGFEALEQREMDEDFQWLAIRGEHFLEGLRKKLSPATETVLIDCWWPKAGLNLCCYLLAIKPWKPMDQASD